MQEEFLNIHTHTPANNAVFNLIVRQDTSIDLTPYSELLSVGIHPWYIDNSEEQFNLLQKIARDTKVVFIGECGLDRLKGAELPIQQTLFEKQIDLAETLHKPLLIHCVRAHSDILHLRKNLQPEMPWVIHGFNAKPQIAEQLLASGCYLSLGKALLHPDSNATQVLKTMPLNRLFLETDDSPISINQIYEATARILNYSTTFLSEQILLNFAAITVKPSSLL